MVWCQGLQLGHKVDVDMAFINLVLLHYILEKYNDNYPDSPYMLSQFASVYLLMGDFKSQRILFQIKANGH
jgi:hypothetical protein